MKFGLVGGAAARRGEEIGDSQGYQDFVDLIVEAETLDYHSIFIVEHHFTGIGQVSATLNMLTYLAAKTSRIRLGTGVTVLPWHNPVILAEQAASLDLLSGGRLDFGIGKGYRDIEFEGFCVPTNEAQARYDESLALIRKAWTSDERFSHHGKFWDFENIVVEPPVLQKPHPPFWTGAGSPSSIARTAEGDFNLLLDQFGSFELTAERVAIFRDACAAAGRPYNPLEVAPSRYLSLTENEAEREAALDRRMNMLDRINDFGQLPGLPAIPDDPKEARRQAEEAAIIGTSEEAIEKIKRLQDMGVEYILLTATGSIQLMRKFAAEVMPAFAEQEEPVPA